MASISEKESPLAVCCTDPSMTKRASQIADHLDLELTSTPDHFSTVLRVHPTHIELADTSGKTNPFLIDFNSPRLHYRQQHGGGRKEAICRAIGLGKKTDLHVIDTTAGLGRDSFILAGQGCRIILFERNPILQILLEDGLQRGRKNPSTLKICKRMELVCTDVRQYKNPIKADVMYLDPMYPHRTKSSLVKKEMRIIRQLVGDDPDGDKLLLFALASGVKRIVVKRPKKGAHLGNIKPTTCLKKKNSRFDIYLNP